MQPWRLGGKTISQEVMVLSHEVLCPRKGAKGAKIHSEYLLANLAAWREIYITQKISARKKSRKGAKDAKINRNISLQPWRLGEKYISQEVMVLAHEML